MPTYQYRCTECGEAMEAVQSFADDALTVCPACGGTLRKVFSAVGVVFKGSGFYRNDSRSGKGSKSGEQTTPSKEKKAEPVGSSTSASNGSESHGSDTQRSDKQRSDKPAPSDGKPTGSKNGSANGSSNGSSSKSSTSSASSGSSSS